MAAGDMPDFVRDHALQFVDVIGGDDQPRMNEDVLAASDKGVDARVADENDLYRFRIEPRRNDHVARNIAEKPFGFGIAQNRLRSDARRHQNQRQHGEKRSETMNKTHGDAAV
jgi:hypothetical protein